MASPSNSDAGSETSRASSATSKTSLPPRYRPVTLPHPATSPSKSTRFYTEGARHVCFVDFSGVSHMPTDVVRQPLPARPRYTAEEEAWIIKFANENPEKTWQHITDGFNVHFNQQRTLKGMQIKGYSLFEAKGKNGSLSMPTGLRQLRKKEEVEEVEDDDDEDEEDEESDDESESEHGNTVASVGKRYTRAQEEWLLSYVASNAKTGRRKDWVSTAAAFAAKFGLERAPMSLNNKWTHLSRQSSASLLLGASEQEMGEEAGRRKNQDCEDSRRDDKMDHGENYHGQRDGSDEQVQA